MSFADWSDKKKKERERVNPREDSKSGSFGEWSDEKQANSVDQTYLTTFFEEANKFLSSAEQDYNGVGWENASSAYNSRMSVFSDLGSKSSTIRRWLENNKDKLGAGTYQSISSALDDFDSGASTIIDSFKKASQFYSQFETEDSWKKYDMGWLSENAEYDEASVSKRKAQYQSNLERLKELDEKTHGGKQDAFSWLWNGVDKQSEQNALIGEYEALKAETTRYEREQKALDDHYQTVTPEFTLGAANRNFTNATMEELLYHDAEFQNYANKLNTYGFAAGRFDDDGTIYDANGDVVYAPNAYSQAYWANTKDDFYNSVVQDKLGMFLSVSEDDIAEANNRLSAGSGNAYDTWAKLVMEGENNAWKQLSDHEIDTYYYYLNTQGQEAAYQYLDDMTIVLTKRATQERADAIAEASVLEQIALNIASIPMNIVGGAVGLLGDIANAMEGKDYNPYSAAHAWTNDANAIRQDTAKDITNATGNIALPLVGTTFGDVYQSLMSGADSMVGAAIGGSAYGVLMGMGASASTMKDMYEKGATMDQMALGGVLSGAFEMFFEKYSIDQLVSIKDTKSFKMLFINALKQGGIEASEEAFTEMANLAANHMIMGSQSDWSTSGETFGERLAAAAKQVAQAGIGGFISGGFSGGLYSGMQGAAYNSQMTEQGAEILARNGADPLKQLELEMAAEENGLNAKSLTKAANKVTGDISRRNANKVGRLSDLMGETVQEQDIAEVKSELTKAGYSKSVVNQVVKAIRNGESISDMKDAEKIQAVVDNVTAGDASVERQTKLTAAILGIRTKSGVNTEKTTSGGVALRNEVDVKEKVSESKETTQISTGEAVQIDKDNAIAKVEVVDGNRVVYYNTDKGVVEASDVAYASENDGLLYESFADMSPAFANAIIKNYDGSTPIQTYINGMREGVILYGAHNFQAVGKDISKDSNFADLSQADQAYALKLGRTYAKESAEAGSNAIKTAIKNAEARAAEAGEDTASKKSKGGRVSFENGAKAATKSQRRAVQLAKILSKAIGVDIAFYDATIKGTKGDDANGYFDQKTNTIHLDLQNSTHDAKTIVFTLSHELVHFIQKWSPAKFNTFATFLMEQYAEHGVPTEQLMANKMAAIGTTDADLAYAELVADACERMLLDSNAVTKLAQLRQTDLSLFDKIKQHIANLLAKIRGEYKAMNYQPSSDEAKALLKMEDVLDKMHALFEEAAVEAAQNYQTAKSLNAESVVVSENGTIQLQMKQYQQTGRSTLLNYMREQYGDSNANDLIATIDNIYNVMAEIKEDTALSVFGNWQDTDVELDADGHPIFTTSINNGDYELNQDFSRVCKKRRQLNFVLNMLAEDPAFEASNLTKEDFVKINKAIKEHGFEIACALCFVDSKRFRQAEWADSFANTWNDIIGSIKVGSKPLSRFNFATKNVNMADEGIQIDETAPVSYRKWENGKVKETRRFKNIHDLLAHDGNNNVRAMARLILENPNLRHEFRGADIIASDGFDMIQRLAPDLRGILDGWGGSSVPKPSSNDAIYDNSILNISGYNADKAFAVGGVRMNSFSDFMAHMFFDYAQAFADLSAKKLPMHSYTKELDFARLWGLTGGKVNMSAVAAIRKNATDLSKIKRKVDKDAATAYEKSIAGLDISRLAEKLGKEESEITHDDVIQNLDDVDYVWADESIDVKSATLLQTGILYDKLTKSQASRCYDLIRDGKIEEALRVAGKENVNRGYAKHLGIIAVGVSKAHILKLLRDPTIRQVIPYHRSGLNPVVAAALNIAFYDDFTDVQNTSVYNGEKQVGIDKDGAKVNGKNLKDFNFYDYFGKTIDGVFYDGKATAAKYLEWCANGVYDESVGDYVYYLSGGGYILASEFHAKGFEVIAKFSEFATEENYYKVIEDFDCYDTITGEHSAQEAVDLFHDGLPSDYKEVLVRALKAEQKVSDDFRDHLDNKGLRDEIMGIVGKNGYKPTIMKQAKKRTIGEKDPHSLTEQDLRDLLQEAKDRELHDGTYFPVRINTPDVLLDAIREVEKRNGVFDEAKLNDLAADKPIAIQVFKARQALAKDGDGVLYQKKRDPSSYAPTFYSSMGKVIDGIKMDKIGASSVVNFLKGKGIRNDEIKWSGIEAFLEGKKSVTKAELQEFVAGSQLDIIEEQLDNNEIPYTEEQLEKIEQHEATRNEIFGRLARAWERIVGESFPIQNVGAGLESSVAHKIIETNAAHKQASFEGRLLSKLREDLRSVIKRNDDFGFENEREALVSIHRNGKEFLDHYELSTSDKAVIVKYLNSLEAFKQLPDRISAKDVETLRSMAETADRQSSIILAVRQEHYEENAKRGTKWGDYKADGGKNYRELLFKMPNSHHTNDSMYTHWGDRTGVLAHARMQDYETSRGKMLFVEEIQSDWHNEGAKEGYLDSADTANIEAIEAKVDELFFAVEDYSTKLTGLAGEWETVEKTEKGAKLLSDYRSAVKELEKARDKLDKKVTDAPFRDNYHEYVMKRLIRMAAEEGYDLIGWTPADMQMDRWNSQRRTNEQMGVKDAKDPNAIAFQEGYTIEYDQEIPKFLRKYGKKWGATVGTTFIKDNDFRRDDLEERLEEIERDIDQYMYELDDDPTEEYAAFIENGISNLQETKATIMDQLLGVEVWSMQITDAMQQSVLYEGQPMFQKKKLTNRTILANALETTIDTSTQEGKLALAKLKEYQAIVAKIEGLEAERAELSAKAHELRFKKGRTPEETKQMNDIQFEANQAANRINTYDKQLLRLEAMSPIENVLKREKEKVRKRTEQKGREALARYRERGNETIRALLERNRESRRKGIESRNKTEMRSKIKHVVSDLNQYLLNGTKERHVPIELQKAVAEALDVVNMDTVGAEERIKKLQEDLAKAKTPEEAAKISKSIYRLMEQGGNMSARLQALKDGYDKIINSDDPIIANSHDEALSNKIAAVVSSVGNTALRDMTLEQLEDVYDMYKAVLHTIRTANKAFKAAKGEEISTLGNRVMEEVETVGGSKTRSVKILDWLKKFAWSALKPIYAMEAIGSKTLTELYENVRSGEDTWAVDVSEARDFFREQAARHGYFNWDRKKQYHFETKRGEKFSLTLEQMMSLYAYSKRNQADLHLELGGFVFDEAIEVVEKKKGIPIKYTVNTAKAHAIGRDTLQSIVDSLTTEQRAFVDEMQAYLSTTMGAKGNEVSLALYDIKLFKEEHYFPLKSAKQFMFEQNEVAGEVRIKNSGFSKETVANANNPIILSNFIDVWSQHVNDMSMYHSFVLPLEDFNRVFNYKTPTSDMFNTESVKMYLQNAYGKQPVDYLRTLLTDLNGGARTDSTTGIINKGIGIFKKAAVFASASVVIQQPSAIARALALIDAKYFVGKPSVRKHSEVWAEVKKYAPVAIIKEMGYFDTNMGMQTTDWITSQEYGGVADKMKALVADGNYRDEILSKAPALADELAWCAIWNAVKRETVHNNKKLVPNSELFMMECGKRFTEIITRTQVYDSVLSRSGMMRSKDTGMKMATAFMAEPTTSLNMIANAILQGKRGHKGFAAKSIGAVAASMILNSILVSIVYAGRDDDEDKTYVEKYLGTLTEELLDSFNPLTLIPFVKDIVSIAQGYDVERSDMAVITDLFTAWENLSKDNRSVYRKVEDFAGAIGAILGLPIKNIMRDARGMYNTVNSFINGEKTTGAGIGNAMLEAVTGDKKSNGQQLYEAMLNNDKVQIERVKARFDDQKDIDYAIRKALRDNDPRIKEAAAARYKGDIAEYTRIAKEIINEGHFSQDNVVAAINAEINAMKPASDSTESSKVDMYKVSDFYAAIANRDEATAYAVKESIIRAAVAEGKDRDDAEKSFYSSFAGICRDAYEAGEINGSKAADLLVRYGDKTEEEAASKVQYWDFQMEYPDYDLSESAVAKYYEEVEPAGISVGIYYDYSKQRSKCTGTDDDGDGKTDSGSVKAEVLRVIDSLPISYEQKDILYYLNGWSKSTIWQAPWH